MYSVTGQAVRRLPRLSGEEGRHGARRLLPYSEERLVVPRAEW
ncbi:MAG: hypothetical protein VX733_12670 [Candidatus Latescibacterota bacterium]|nr:hypothetical protein [Candidatus Latescibacterota bacterium]